MTSQYHQVTAPPSVARHGAAAPAVDRRARLVLRRLDPWSVLKFSLLFYFCMLLVGLLVLAVVWVVLSSMGVFDAIQRFAENLSVTFELPAAAIFRSYLLFGLLGVILWSAVTVLATLLFNLVNDITGGIEITLAERERRPYYQVRR